MPQVGELRPFTMALGQPLTLGGEHRIRIRGAHMGVVAARGAFEVYVWVGLGTVLGRRVTAMALALGHLVGHPVSRDQ